MQDAKDMIPTAAGAWMEWKWALEDLAKRIYGNKFPIFPSTVQLLLRYYPCKCRVKMRACYVGGRVVAGDWHIAGRIIRSVHGYLTYILFPFPFTRPQISWRRNEIRLDNESRGSWKWIEYEIILYPLSVWSPLSRRKRRTIIIIGLISVSSWSSVWVSGSRNEFYFLSSSGSALPLAQERTFSHRNSQVEYA